MVKPLIDFLREVPDPRCKRKKKHDYAEILMLVIIGFLAGKQSLRRIRRFCRKNKKTLKRQLKLKGEIPSISTFSRVLSSTDTTLLTCAFMNWIGGILDTRGIHIIIDGKALRAATERLKDKKAPYILNAIDQATKLVIAQLDIPEKANEMTAIPEMIEMLDITGSTITIDAIGATSKILNLINEKSGFFVQQIKKNCPATYQEIEDLFEGLAQDEKQDPESFMKEYKDCYSCTTSNEINRDRYEYRTMKAYHGDKMIQKIRDDIPCIKCVGQSVQVRIPKEVDENGMDITPSKTDFLKNGSRRCPVPKEGDQLMDHIQRVGIISNKECDAEELAHYKRSHWAIENSLHHVLDEDFLEDKCPAKKSKVTLSILRKFAYNIIRLILMRNPDENISIIEMMDDIGSDLELAEEYLFESIPSLY